MIEFTPWLRVVSRNIAIVLVAGWSLLVWNLLTGTRFTTEPWYPWMPFVYDLAHAVLFGVEAVLIGLALRPGAVGRPTRTWLLAGALAFAYGALLEWRQGMIPGRVASVFDVAVNGIGAFGLPWALSTGSLLNGRVAMVAAAAAACAALSWSV